MGVAPLILLYGPPLMVLRKTLYPHRSEAATSGQSRPTLLVPVVTPDAAGVAGAAASIVTLSDGDGVDSSRPGCVCVAVITCAALVSAEAPLLVMFVVAPLASADPSRIP